MAFAGAVRAGRAFVELFADDSKLVRGLRGAQRKLRAFSSFAGSLGSKLLGGAGALAAPFLISAKVFTSFSDAMLKVKAVTGASGKDFDMLSGKAKELGRTTSFTASAVASAMVELGRAGFDPGEIDNSISSVLSLARATDTELANAANITGQALRGFNLDASESGRVADVLTATANGSAQTIDDLGEAMKVVAPLANEAGESLEDTAASLGILANNAIKGSLAGNSMARAYKNLSGADVQKMLQRQGVAAVDANGNMRKLSTIMAELGEKTRGLGSAARLQIFEKLFGRGQAAALKLAGVNANFAEMSGKIHDSEGAAKSAADTMDSGIGGAARRLMSALEGIAIAIGEAVAPMLETLAEKLGEVAGWLTKVVEKNKGFIQGVLIAIGVIAGVGSVLVVAGVAAAALNAVIGVAITVWGLLGTAISLVGTLIGALLSPIGLVIAAVALLSSFFIDWGGVASDVTSKAGDEWNTFRKRAVGAWGGIRDAIAAGDLGLAFKIVTLFLKSEWLRIVGVLKSKWNSFVGFFQSIWTNAVFGAARIFTNAWSGLKKFWLNFTGILADGWTMFTGFVQRTWNTTVGFLAKAWAKLKEKVTGKKGASASSIDKETERRNAGVQREVDRKLMAGERERKSRLAGIEDQRKGTIEALDDEQRRREQARADANQKDLDDNQAAIDKARAELAKAVAKAKGLSNEADKKDDELKKKKPGEDVKKSGAGVFAAVTGKTSIEGTRSGFDRFGAAGKQDPVVKFLKKIEEHAEETKNNTRGILSLRRPPNL